MSKQLLNQSYLELVNKQKALKKELSTQSKPKNHLSAHHRISSMTVQVRKPLGTNSTNFSMDAPDHHKAKSLAIKTNRLKNKQENQDELLEKIKNYSKVSTRTTSFDIPAYEDSISVSYSSEDSLVVLQKQVNCVKNIVLNEISDDESPRINISGISFSDISDREKNTKGPNRPFKLAEICLIYSILTIKTN
ncbi:hypothetical protein SteCoe_9654 [Stentor coeruleus]|uniref:Uncharacterized protein n=1 Tax=Stentor coeruleus TaxID=5963 RepID=A0A1R2CHK4_9CILI|nr:hypothetical protein SteCoe_9654 [Stentor coeruleus]